MNNWIWVGIIAVVLIIVWLSLRKKKDNYGMVKAEGSFWDKVKDACCSRNK